MINEEKISILISFHDKIKAAVNNPFVAANKCRRFLAGLSKSLMQLLLSQLGLYSRILKTIFHKNRLKCIFRENLACYRVNETQNREVLYLYISF